MEIPLPAQAERIRLLKLYARGIPFSPEAVQDAAERTEGTTASFARELVRRAVVAAALDGVPVADAHLGKAVDELMADARPSPAASLAAAPAKAAARRALGRPGFRGPGFGGPASEGRASAV